MANNFNIFAAVFCFLLLAERVIAKERIQAYFMNDSVNGLKFSDAYETHNMGLIYSTGEYHLKLDLGIVSPDMYVYRNEYREANRSFGELITIEIEMPANVNDDFRFYARVKGTGEFGIDKIQDFAHRLLSLQQVNKVNDLIRMPENAWVGIGLRNEFKTSFLDLDNTTLKVDGFVGSDTTFVNAKFIKKFQRPVVTYDLSFGGRFVAYDKIVSAPPINAEERKIIPEVSFGITYNAGPYNIFLRDSFSIPSIKADSDLYGVFSMGASYSF